MDHLLPGLVALAGALAAAPVARADDRIEHAVKAALVYKVARFVDWPEGNACPGGVVTVAVLDEDPFGDAITRAVEGRSLGGHPVQVRRLARVRDVPRCSVLWLSGGQGPPLGSLLAQVRGGFIVVVGDGTAFASQGGMVGLRVENERLVIEVNADAASAAGVRISSRLLGVARLVKTVKVGEGTE